MRVLIIGLMMFVAAICTAQDCVSPFDLLWAKGEIVTNAVDGEVRNRVGELETLATDTAIEVDELGDDVRAHTSDTSNPHNVTAEQVGAVTDEMLNNALRERGVLTTNIHGWATGTTRTIPGSVVGIYDNAISEYTDTIYFTSPNAARIELEDLRGDATELTLTSTTSGYANALFDVRVVSDSAFATLSSGANTYTVWFDVVDGTNVTFSPPVDGEDALTIESVNQATATDSGVVNGRFDGISSLPINYAPPPTSSLQLQAGNGVIIATGGLLYASLSSDGGATWRNLTTTTNVTRYYGVTYFSGMWYMATRTSPDSSTFKIYTSSDAVEWELHMSGSGGVKPQRLFSTRQKIYIGNYGAGFYYYDGFGTITGPQYVMGNKALGLTSLAEDGRGILYATVSPTSVLLKSVDGGDTWSQVAPNIFTGVCQNVTASGNNIYVICNDGDIYASYDNGSTWELKAHTSGKTSSSVSTIVDDTLYIAYGAAGANKFPPVIYNSATNAATSFVVSMSDNVTRWTSLVDAVADDSSAGTDQVYYAFEFAPGEWSVWNSGAWSVVATGDLHALSAAVQTNVAARMARSDLGTIITYDGAFVPGNVMRVGVIFLNDDANDAPTAKSIAMKATDSRVSAANASNYDVSFYEDSPDKTRVQLKSNPNPPPTITTIHYIAGDSE